MTAIERTKCSKGFLNIFISSFFLLMAFSGTGQGFNSDSIQKKFAQKRKENFEEKLFMHADKSVYAAGEMIWFKLYCVDAQHHIPVAVSKVAYVEILNEENKPVLQAKVELKDGYGNGSFQLPFNIPSGTFIIRAYTAWMKNFDPVLYFHQSITVVNTVKQPDWSKLETAPTYDFQLLPEGGHLVQNIESRIAFRLVDNFGKGIAAKGFVIKEQSDTTTHFESNGFGLGTFLLKPLPGNNYKAVIALVNGERILKDFPPVQEKGLVMRLSENENNVIIRVSGNITTDSIYLIAHSRQSILYSEVAPLFNNRITFTLPKSKLQDGINHFTIVNSGLQPLCERLYFKTPTEILNIEANTNTPVFKKREKVVVDVETNVGQLPSDAELSIAVRTIDSITPVNHNNIFSYLFLSSELKGTIENPSYYFLNKGAAVDSAIDNLMLVHGWSRFNWHNVFTKPPAPIQFLPEYEGQLINAFLKNKNAGTGVSQIPVYFSAPNGNATLDYAHSDVSGKLRFRAPQLTGSSYVVLQSPNRDDSLYSFTLENPFSDKFSSYKTQRFSISQKNEAEITRLHQSTQIQNLYFPENFRFEKPERNAAIAFFGLPDKSYRLDDYTRFTTMEEVLREYVAEVRVKKSSQHFSLSVMNTPYLLHFNESPLVLLDGVPVFNMDKIMELDPLTIRQIDVVSRKYFYGASVFNGIVSFNSYEGKVQNWQTVTAASILPYEGLQLKRDFFSPVYDLPSQIQSRLPDYRNVLYWAPSIQTGKKGNQNISFYTSDLPGEYLIEIQGMNKSGQAGYTTLKIRVN